MRLKEDKSSWNSSSIIRRDFRRDNSAPVQKKYKSQKDTKKWCKGKVGVEHEYKLEEKLVYGFLNYKKMICANCGKEKFSRFLQS